MVPPYTIAPLGDTALLVDFGNRIDEALNKYVMAAFRELQQSSPHFTDLVPAYSSIAVYYDVLSFSRGNHSAFEAAKRLVVSCLQKTSSGKEQLVRQLRLPVCYAASFAPDLEEMATQKNMSVEELVQLHASKTYRVYMIGFLPGFAYMGKVDSRLATPRRAQPRISVPAGSVGIAGKQTGIYPLGSPGGWNIIGRTPLKLFDAGREDPVLLQPGDEITFFSITEDEFAHYQGRTS